MMINAVRRKPPVIERVKKMILQAFPVTAFNILPARDASIINWLWLLFQNLLILKERFSRNSLGSTREHVHHNARRLRNDIIKDQLHRPHGKVEQCEYINRQQYQIFNLNTD